MSNSKKIIGFASQYYTLWDSTVETIYITDVYGKHWPSYEKVHYTYLKNISTNLDRVRELYPTIAIDETLRGKTQSFTQDREKDLSPELLKFGKHFGKTIYEVCDLDFDYIMWLRTNCYSRETRILIDKMPRVIEFDTAKRLAEESAKAALLNYVLKSGTYTVKFNSNPKLQTIADIKTRMTEYNTGLEFVDDAGINLDPGKYYAIANIELVGNDWPNYYIIFENHKSVDGLYPYIMPEINGKTKRVKGKELELNLVPVSTAWYDPSWPAAQILVCR